MGYCYPILLFQASKAITGPIDNRITKDKGGRNRTHAIDFEDQNSTTKLLPCR
jgi:hypothetical protein